MDAVEEVKSRLNIEDVIGEYVELKRAGRNWKGLSPFGNEKTPSFMVSPEKQIWHDFSSGKGGNMFSFVMEVEGLDFKGALELLARKAGVELEQYRSKNASARSKEKERLYAVLDLAAKFYQVQFSQNKTALEYVFKKRQFAKETALEWRLGYSPNTGRALLDFLKGKEFTEREITNAGLTARAYRGGVQDMFRGRLMVPLQDGTGRVIGFTARLLIDDPNAPKYINTPQTPLYDKSRHVYGLHLAKEAIRRNNFVVLVEGNLDVIASHQVGVRQVVATAGTAMTEQHLKALSRFTGDIRLSFDADKAGMNATERALPIASKVGVSLSVITIPNGKDPDELIKNGGVETWERVITAPQYALDWLIDRYKIVLDITTAPGKREFSDIVLAVVNRLQDPVEREHYLEKVAETLSVSKAALLSKLAQQTTAEKPKLKKSVAEVKIPSKTVSDYVKAQSHLLTIALKQPKLRPLLAPIAPDMLIGDEPKLLRTFLGEHPDFAGDPVTASKLHPIADYVKMLLLQYEELYEDVGAEELAFEADRLQTRLIAQYVKMQKQRLAQKLQTATEPETTALLEQAKQFDALLKSYKIQA